MLFINVLKVLTVRQPGLASSIPVDSWNMNTQSVAWCGAWVDDSSVAASVQSTARRDDGSERLSEISAARAVLRLPGVVVMLVVKRRYSLLICRGQFYSIWKVV
jgi:hypothetical protein